MFPGIFRGTLDSRAVTISDEMALAAAMELAKCAEERGLSEEAILPTMSDWQVVPRLAAATAMKAQESGLAKVTRSCEEYFEMAKRRILDAQRTLEVLTREGLIAPLPEDRAASADAPEDGPAAPTVTVAASRKA